MSRALELPKLQMLRESFLQKTEVLDWVGVWWADLSLDDRRDLLALSGLDDSIESARRRWQQYLKPDRDALIAKCARLHKITGGVRWA